MHTCDIFIPDIEANEYFRRPSHAITLFENQPLNLLFRYLAMLEQITGECAGRCSRRSLFRDSI